MRRLTSLVAAAVVATGASLVAAGPASAADATVTVVHGVPLDAAAVVDVYANGNKIIDDFKYKEIKTLTVPAGSYDLAVTASDAADASSPILQAKGVAVASGGNYSVVAHLTADGTPALTPFANPTGKTEAGKASLTVRHAAAAPKVDVRANGDVIVAGLANGSEKSLMVPAGTYDVDVVLAGTSTVAIGPLNGVKLQTGTTYIAYAVGNADKGYDVLLQSYQTGAKTAAGAGGTASGGTQMPTSVPAGEGAPEQGAGWAYGAAALLGLAGLALGGTAVRRVRAVKVRR
jgi:hypothetical protein